MSPSASNSATAHIASHLRNQVFYHIDNDLLDSANFLAGRLYTFEPRNPDAHHILALTYLRLHRFQAATDYSSKYGAQGRHLGCAYVFAQACLQLGRYREGITALEKCQGNWTSKSNWNRCSESRRTCIPDAAACWTLMGRLWATHGDSRRAGDCFVEAHKQNPFVWEAFEGLCNVGADLDVAQMFKATPEMSSAAAMPDPVRTAGGAVHLDEPNTRLATDAVSTIASRTGLNQQIFTPSTDPFNETTFRAPGESTASFNLPRVNKAPPVDWDTPTTNATSIVLDEDVAMEGVPRVSNESFAVPAAPSRRVRTGQHFDVGERVRPPAMRGQSSEAGHADTQHQRKPSASLHKRTVSGQQPAHATSRTLEGDVSAAVPRRSNRLFGQGTSSSIRSTSQRSAIASDASASLIAKDAVDRPSKVATGTKGRIGSTVGRVVSGNRKMLPPDRNGKEKTVEMKRAPSRTGNAPDRNVQPAMSTTDKTVSQTQQKPFIAPVLSNDLMSSVPSNEALNTVLSHFRELALGAYSTTTFNTPLALKTFRNLPGQQRESPYVLSQLAKTHYDNADYRASEEIFARLIKLQPSRVEDIEVYSTVLWHLKKDSALAHLCWTLRESDNNAPQTWVAVGNTFSLSREHDQAIQAFKRATQINPRFAYAWTLMGHEYIANEEIELALTAFRKAVAVDQRGYGGWYGLGKSYERVGKLEDAERHYRIASSINPSNATLLVCIGVVLEKLHNRKAALANYSKALELQPSSALARFKKARVLMHMRFYAEALEELNVLKEQAGDEANVWFLLGKCWKGLGDRGEAVRCLTTALNLDVKVSACGKLIILLR